MPDITLLEKGKRNLLIGKSWEYLCDNFHKFSEDNRIRIALEIVKKNIPQEIINDSIKDTNIIIVRDKEKIGTESQAISRPLPVLDEKIPRTN